MKKDLIKSFAMLGASLAGLLLVLLTLKGSAFEPLIGGMPVSEKIRKVSLASWDWQPGAKPPTPVRTQEEPDIFSAESSAFKEFPHLATSYRLAQKVLKSDEDWDEIKAIHADPAAIEASAQYLTQDQVLAEDVSLAHFRHVDFLKRALSLKDNPSETLVLEKISSVLRYEPKNFQSLDAKGKQVLLGDKIDLIYIMKAYAPGALEKMLQQPENARLAKLVQYAEKNRKFLQLVDL